MSKMTLCTFPRKISTNEFVWVSVSTCELTLVSAWPASSSRSASSTQPASHLKVPKQCGDRFRSQECGYGCSPQSQVKFCILLLHFSSVWRINCSLSSNFVHFGSVFKKSISIRLCTEEWFWLSVKKVHRMRPSRRTQRPRYSVSGCKQILNIILMSDNRVDMSYETLLCC